MAISTWKQIQDAFTLGAESYPDVSAHWDSREGVWTFQNAPAGENAAPAEVEAQDRFKRAAREAVLRLGKPVDEQPAWHTWLDLMRNGKRGFRHVQQIHPLHFHAAISAIEEDNAIDPQAIRLLKDGNIAHVFSESAGFCEDLALSGTEGASTQAAGDFPKVDVACDTRRGGTEPAHGRPATVANGADGGGATWEAIEVSFLSDHRVQIRNGTNAETLNYGELGFADRRAKQGKPNRAWVTLRVMAEQNGIIRDGAKMNAEWSRVEKRIQEIRKVLRGHFGIAADPIPFVEGTGYQTRFKIGCSPSFHT